jgi:hypothetical protein
MSHHDQSIFRSHSAALRLGNVKPALTQALRRGQALPKLHAWRVAFLPVIDVRVEQRASSGARS